MSAQSTNSEETIFSAEDISVTTTGVVAGGQTFAVGGITSVKTLEPKMSGGASAAITLFSIAGGWLIVQGGESVVFALICFGAAVAAFFTQKLEHKIVLTTASGEVEAYATRDAEKAKNVVDAISEAIVAGG